MKPIQTLATALAISTALTASAMAATKVGVIGAANPQVYATGEGGAERLLKVGDDIFLGDKLRTTEKGSAQLMFLDKSALTISPDSAVVIDEFVYDPAAKDGNMSINSAKGAFRFIGGALTKKKAVNIKTPVSTIGIRGGIVDTHIDAGGETDAVFLFGKEMTMTNGAGQTTSTTAFGSGLGLASAGAAPTALPQNVVATRMTNSPTQAAERSAPPANPETLNRIESKMETVGSATSKAAETNPPAAEGGAPASDGAAPAGDNSSGNDGGGGNEGTSNEGGNTPAASGGEGADAGSTPAGDAPQSHATAGTDAAPTPQGNAEGGVGGPFIAADEGGAGSPAAAPNAAPAPAATEGAISSAPVANAAPVAAPIAAAPVTPNAAPIAAPVTAPVAAAPVAAAPVAAPRAPTINTSFTAGVGLKPIAAPTVNVNVSAVAGGSNSQEKLRSNIDTAVRVVAASPNAPATGSTGTLALGDTGKLRQAIVNTDPAKLPTTITPVVQNTPTAPIAPIAPVAPTTTTTISAGDGFKQPETTAVPPTVLPPVNTTTSTSTSNNQNTVSGGGNQNTVSGGGNQNNATTTLPPTLALSVYAWDVNDDNDAPISPATTTLRGRIYHRDEGANINSADDDISAGDIDAFDGNSHSNTDLHNRHVFKVKTTNEYDGGYANTVSGSSNEYFVGFFSKQTSAGYDTLSAGEVYIEDDEGQVYDDTNFSGFSYRTTSGAFNYYQAQFDETANSTIETQHIRAYLLDSPLYDATSLSTAYLAYNNMLAGSVASASPTGGIIEYDFLPELIVGMDAASSDIFGIFDYNHIDGLNGNGQNNQIGYGNARNANGLFVDWGKKRFLGGSVNFTGTNGAPSIQTLFGKVNDSVSAGISEDSTNSFDGQAFDGVYYELTQGTSNTPNERSNLGISSEISSFAAGSAAASPIEAFTIQGKNSNNTLAAQQSLVQGNGANGLSGSLNSKTYLGLSAGLATDNAGYVTLLKTATPNDTVGSGFQGVKISVSADGTVGGTVKYFEKEDDGVFTAGESHTLDFGTYTNPDKASAALKNDLYAMELGVDHQASSGESVKGALVSMHTAIAPTDANLVCSTCDFAHWGVWQADHNIATTGAAVEQTALVPYVAGEMTPAGADLGAVNPNGFVTYSGDIAANKFTSANNNITNETGTFQAVIDLNNRSLHAYAGNVGGMKFGVNTNDYAMTLAGVNMVANAHPDASATVNELLSGTNIEGYTFDNYKQTFTAPVGCVETSCSSFHNISGNVNGALFGATGQEVGGNFYIKNNTTQDKAGGIYLGKR